jgi:hypothetical protein
MPTPGTARDACSPHRRNHPRTMPRPRIRHQKTRNTRHIAPTPRRKRHLEHKCPHRNRKRTRLPRTSERPGDSRHQRCSPRCTPRRLPRTNSTPRTSSLVPSLKNSHPDREHRNSSVASASCTLRSSPRKTSRTAHRHSWRPPPDSRSGWGRGEHTPPGSAEPDLAAFSPLRESTRSCGPRGACWACWCSRRA